MSQSHPTSKTAVRMPPGAFLRQPSPDIKKLVHAVTSDPAVAIRYARLFHLPVKLVPHAFAQLHLKRLDKDRVMQVHYVKDGEALVYKPRRVKKGTPVYCLPDGTPLLIQVCGNPIRSRLTPDVYSSTSVPNFDSNEGLVPAPVIVGATPSGLEIRSFVPPLTPLPVIPVVEAENVLPPTSLPLSSPTLSPPAMKAAALPPVYAWAHGGPGLIGLAPLALLSLLDFGGGGGFHAGALPFPIVPTLPGASQNSGSPTTPGASGATPLVPSLPGTGAAPGVPAPNGGTPETGGASPIEVPNGGNELTPGETMLIPTIPPIGMPELPAGGNIEIPAGPSGGVPPVIITPIGGPVGGPILGVAPEPGILPLSLTTLMGACWLIKRRRRG